MAPLFTERSEGGRTNGTGGVGTTNNILPIEAIETITFAAPAGARRDNEGHSHPSEEHESEKSVTKITAEGDNVGYCFDGTGDALPLLRDILIGEDALNREKIWQKLIRSQRIHNVKLHEEVIATVDLALWDLAGRYVGLPIYKLLGGHRDKVPAYTSTMIADEDLGLGSAEEFADYAADCQAEGFPAFKLHTWFPPIDQDWERDAEACRAVRERVGDEMDLMLDCSAHYSRMESLKLGRVLEELDFHWYEEMMNEQSMSSYQWITRELDIPICGPETQKAWGKMGIRADWIKNDAIDICRTGVWDVGGITPVLKIVRLCESFNIACELHGSGAAHLQVLGAMGIPGEYYERGLMHPEYDYEKYNCDPPWLNDPIDPVDSEGNVRIPRSPGLGYDIDWNYIDENRVDA